MKFRMMGATAVTASVLAPLAGAVPVAAVPGNGSITMPEVVMYEGYNCDDYVFSYSFELPAGADSWSMDSELVDSRTGSSISTGFDYGDPDSTLVTGQGDIQICSGINITAELSAVVEYVDYDANVGGRGTFRLPASLVTIRPPFSKTTTKDVTAVGEDARGRSYVSGVVRVQVEKPRGYFPARGYDACLQVRSPGSQTWKKLRGSCTRTNRKGVAYAGGKIVISRAIYVRAYTPDDLEYNLGSASRPVKVRR
jgi:hypothetical protein